MATGGGGFFPSRFQAGGVRVSSKSRRTGLYPMTLHGSIWTASGMHPKRRGTVAVVLQQRADFDLVVTLDHEIQPLHAGPFVRLAQIRERERERERELYWELSITGGL